MDVSTRMRSACPYPLLYTKRGASESGGIRGNQARQASLQVHRCNRDMEANGCTDGPCVSRLKRGAGASSGPPVKSQQGGCEFRLSLKARPRHASLPRDLIDAASASASDGGFGLETPFPPKRRVLSSKPPRHWGHAAPADRSHRVGFLCVPYPDSSKHGTRPQEPSEQTSASPSFSLHPPCASSRRLRGSLADTARRRGTAAQCRLSMRPCEPKPGADKTRDPDAVEPAEGLPLLFPDSASPISPHHGYNTLPQYE